MLVPQCHHPHHSPLTFPPRALAPPHSPFPASPFFANTRASTSVQPRFSASRSEAVPQSAIQRIAEKLRSLGFKEDDDGGGGGLAPKSSPSSAGEIFVPLPKRLPKNRVGHTIDTNWSTPENPVPEPGSGGFVERYRELRQKPRKERELEREKGREGGRGADAGGAEAAGGGAEEVEGGWGEVEEEVEDWEGGDHGGDCEWDFMRGGGRRRWLRSLARTCVG